MPHRKNAKGDIGFQKRMSDSTNINNVYLTEEGWVYRHYKRADKSKWYDELIVAGQVKTDISTPDDMEIHGVPNKPVSKTLNDLPERYPEFETGGGTLASDIDLSPHVSVEDRDEWTGSVYGGGAEQSQRGAAEVKSGQLLPATGDDFINTPWDALNILSPERDELETQIPEGWSGTSSPSDVENYPEEPAYPGGAGDAGAGSGDGYKVAFPESFIFGVDDAGDEEGHGHEHLHDHDHDDDEEGPAESSDYMFPRLK